MLLKSGGMGKPLNPSTESASAKYLLVYDYLFVVWKCVKW